MIIKLLKKIVRRARYFTSIFLARILLPSPKGELVCTAIKQILIYGAMGIGNMVMFTPTLKAIRRHFPDAHITLLVKQSGCEQVVIGSGIVDEIIKTKPGTFKTLDLTRQIRSRHFDLLFSNFHGVFFNWVTLLSGIPYRAGHCTSPGWKSSYDHLYNIKVQMGADQHEVDRDLILVQALDIRVAEDNPLFHVSPDDVDFAINYLQQHKVQEACLIVGVQIGTWRVQSWKQWDLARLANACDMLIEKYAAEVIAMGSPNHKEELDTFLSAMQRRPVVALGKVGIKQAAAILEHCDFVISNDSGLMHIAAAIGTPVIAIYGPTDQYRTSPCRYGNQHIVLRKDLPCSPCFCLEGATKVLSCTDRRCLELITVDDVLSAADEIIGRVAEQTEDRA